MGLVVLYTILTSAWMSQGGEEFTPNTGLDTSLYSLDTCYNTVEVSRSGLSAVRTPSIARTLILVTY